MDWIRKIEEEKQAEQQRQAQTQDAKLKRESEESERFQIVKDKLCPVIESSISELKKRTGFELKIHVCNTSIGVSAPSRRREIEEIDGGKYKFGPKRDHHFAISNVSNDGKTVHVEAIKACEIYRNEEGWAESGLSHADYFGRDETVFGVLEDIDVLLSKDIHLLLEWLVRLELHGAAPLPDILAIRQRKGEEQKEEAKKKVALLKAYGGLASGLAGFFLMFVHPVFALLGPVSIYAGLCAKSELSIIGRWNYNSDGRGSAMWAIGLGVFESLILVAAIF